jgi:hypothetical protein
VEILCEDLYCPGPSRKWSEDAGDELLQQDYADNLIDALMQQADTDSTLNECVAIQIDAGEGDYAKKPITYCLWKRQQLAYWPNPNKANEVEAVVTIDRYDLKTRYRLWSDAEVWTYATKRADETAGGRVATKVMDSDPASPWYTGPHEYGCLPFSLIHYSLPIADLNVPSVGRFLHKAGIRIDNRLNELDESIGKHLNPVPVAEGVPIDWKPVVEPMRFIRMPSSGPIIGPSGGYEPGAFAKLYFLEAHIDTGAWDDLLKYCNQALQAARVPLKAVALEPMGVQSGIALIVEHAPLLKRARQRHGPFGVYECDLAKKTLLCAGNHYGKTELVAAAEAGRLLVTWPQPSIPIPTPDGLQLLVAEVQAGMKSHLQAIAQWNGIGREAALELVEQMAQDDADLAKAHPDLAEINVPKPEPTPEELAAIEAEANGKTMRKLETPHRAGNTVLWPHGQSAGQNARQGHGTRTSGCHQGGSDKLAGDLRSGRRPMNRWPEAAIGSSRRAEKSRPSQGVRPGRQVQDSVHGCA